MTASPKKSPGKALGRARKEPARQLAKFSNKLAVAMDVKGLKTASLPKLRSWAAKDTETGAITREVIGLLRRLVAVKEYVGEGKTDGLEVKGEVDEQRMSFDAVSVDRMSGETDYFEASSSLNREYAEDEMSVDGDSVRDSIAESMDEKKPMPIMSPGLFRQRVNGPDRFATLYRRAVTKQWCLYCVRYALRSYSERKTEVLRVECSPPTGGRIRCPTCCERNIVCNWIPAMMTGDRDDLMRILELMRLICSFAVVKAQRQRLALPLETRKTLASLAWDLTSDFVVAVNTHVKEQGIGGPKKCKTAETQRRKYRTKVDQRKKLLLSTFPVPKTRRGMEEDMLWKWEAQTSPRMTADEKAYPDWRQALHDSL
ncbi:hypothetical protein CDD80_1121 [Ophiocordyceps camponoti-rufipedis]|uniref:Uncharacterized protein n=1 Tax=Ophiocordyceps camponoti-rufipedis TaxID=2004952 RepID=A0A2C5ZAK2_9HYPO|nr:hypothetical protein CDD80_1121 [Ophiocordyceps camponoti-rufipedis]